MENGGSHTCSGLSNVQQLRVQESREKNYKSFNYEKSEMVRRRGGAVGTRSSRRLNSSGSNSAQITSAPPVKSVPQKPPDVLQPQLRDQHQTTTHGQLVTNDNSNQFGVVACPECKNKFNGTTCRPLQEGCGHVKCRACLIKHEDCCIQCSNGVSIQQDQQLNHSYLQLAPAQSVPAQLPPSKPTHNGSAAGNIPSRQTRGQPPVPWNSINNPTNSTSTTILRNGPKFGVAPAGFGHQSSSSRNSYGGESSASYELSQVHGNVLNKRKGEPEPGSSTNAKRVRGKLGNPGHVQLSNAVAEPSSTNAIYNGENPVFVEESSSGINSSTLNHFTTSGKVLGATTRRATSNGLSTSQLIPKHSEVPQKNRVGATGTRALPKTKSTGLSTNDQSTPEPLNTICTAQLQELQLQNIAAPDTVTDESKDGDYDTSNASFQISADEGSEEAAPTSEATTSKAAAGPEKKKKKRSPVFIHEHIKILGGDPQMYQCSICTKKFKTKAHIKYHEFCQNGEKPFKCEQCGQGFIAKSHYEYHLRTHTGERPYVCPKCGKGFNQRGKVTRHMRSHTGEKPFTCTTCGRGFANAQAMRSHFLIHTGERPFACQHCSKRFTGMTNLKKHIITHTGERPFMCVHCGKSFGLKWTLDLHMRTHSSERPYACDQCSRAFSNSKDLRRHLVIHSGERPFKCWICGTAFRRKDNLDRHIKNTHNQPKEVAKRLANEAAAHYLATTKAAAAAAAGGDGAIPSTSAASLLSFQPPVAITNVAPLPYRRANPRRPNKSKNPTPSVIITAEVSPSSTPTRPHADSADVYILPNNDVFDIQENPNNAVQVVDEKPDKTGEVESNIRYVELQTVNMQEFQACNTILGQINSDAKNSSTQSNLVNKQCEPVKPTHQETTKTKNVGDNSAEPRIEGPHSSETITSDLSTINEAQLPNNDLSSRQDSTDTSCNRKLLVRIKLHDPSKSTETQDIQEVEAEDTSDQNELNEADSASNNFQTPSEKEKDFNTTDGNGLSTSNSSQSTVSADTESTSVSNDERENEPSLEVGNRTSEDGPGSHYSGEMEAEDLFDDVKPNLIHGRTEFNLDDFDYSDPKKLLELPSESLLGFYENTQNESKIPNHDEFDNIDLDLQEMAQSIHVHDMNKKSVTSNEIGVDIMTSGRTSDNSENGSQSEKSLNYNAEKEIFEQPITATTTNHLGFEKTELNLNNINTSEKCEKPNMKEIEFEEIPNLHEDLASSAERLSTPSNFDSNKIQDPSSNLKENITEEMSGDKLNIEPETSDSDSNTKNCTSAEKKSLQNDIQEMENCELSTQGSLLDTPNSPSLLSEQHEESLDSRECRNMTIPEEQQSPIHDFVESSSPIIDSNTPSPCVAEVKMTGSSRSENSNHSTQNSPSENYELENKNSFETTLEVASVTENYLQVVEHQNEDDVQDCVSEIVTMAEITASKLLSCTEANTEENTQNSSDEQSVDQQVAKSPNEIIEPIKSSDESTANMELEERTLEKKLDTPQELDTDDNIPRMEDDASEETEPFTNADTDIIVKNNTSLSDINTVHQTENSIVNGQKTQVVSEDEGEITSFKKALTTINGSTSPKAIAGIDEIDQEVISNEASVDGMSTAVELNYDEMRTKEAEMTSDVVENQSGWSNNGNLSNETTINTSELTNTDEISTTSQTKMDYENMDESSAEPASPEHNNQDSDIGEFSNSKSQREEMEYPLPAVSSSSHPEQQTNAEVMVTEVPCPEDLAETHEENQSDVTGGMVENSDLNIDRSSVESPTSGNENVIKCEEAVENLEELSAAQPMPNTTMNQSNELKSSLTAETDQTQEASVCEMEEEEFVTNDVPKEQEHVPDVPMISSSDGIPSGSDEERMDLIDSQNNDSSTEINEGEVMGSISADKETPIADDRNQSELSENEEIQVDNSDLQAQIMSETPEPINEPTLQIDSTEEPAQAAEADTTQDTSEISYELEEFSSEQDDKINLDEIEENEYDSGSENSDGEFENMEEDDQSDSCENELIIATPEHEASEDKATDLPQKPDEGSISEQYAPQMEYDQLAANGTEVVDYSTSNSTHMRTSPLLHSDQPASETFNDLRQPNATSNYIQIPTELMSDPFGDDVTVLYAGAALSAVENNITGPPRKYRLLYAEALGVKHNGDEAGRPHFVYTAATPNQEITEDPDQAVEFQGISKMNISTSSFQQYICEPEIPSAPFQLPINRIRDVYSPQLPVNVIRENGTFIGSSNCDNPESQNLLSLVNQTPQNFLPASYQYRNSIPEQNQSQAPLSNFNHIHSTPSTSRAHWPTSEFSRRTSTTTETGSSYFPRHEHYHSRLPSNTSSCMFSTDFSRASSNVPLPQPHCSASNRTTSSIGESFRSSDSARHSPHVHGGTSPEFFSQPHSATGSADSQNDRIEDIARAIATCGKIAKEERERRLYGRTLAEIEMERLLAQSQQNFNDGRHLGPRKNYLSSQPPNKYFKK